MRAKKINEIQNFEQGGDPYQKLNVGKYDDNYDWNNSQEGDKIQLIETLYSTIYMDPDLLHFMGESLVSMCDLTDNLTVEWEKGAIFEYIDDDWYGLNENGAEVMIDSWWVFKRKNNFKKIR